MNKFEKTYKLIGGDIGCPIGCEICEEGPLYFLPGEIDFLSEKLKISKENLAFKRQFRNHNIWMLKAEERHCLYYRCHKCANRDARALDCRSYPVIPYVKGNKIFVKLDKKCPMVKKNKIKKSFIDRAQKAWRYISPPKWWLDFYNLR